MIPCDLLIGQTGRRARVCIQSEVYSELRDLYFGEQLATGLKLLSVHKKETPEGFYYCEGEFIFKDILGMKDDLNVEMRGNLNVEIRDNTILEMIENPNTKMGRDQNLKKGENPNMKAKENPNHEAGEDPNLEMEGDTKEMERDNSSNGSYEEHVGDDGVARSKRIRKAS